MFAPSFEHEIPNLVYNLDQLGKKIWGYSQVGPQVFCASNPPPPSPCEKQCAGSTTTGQENLGKDRSNCPASECAYKEFKTGNDATFGYSWPGCVKGCGRVYPYDNFASALTACEDGGKHGAACVGIDIYKQSYWVVTHPELTASIDNPALGNSSIENKWAQALLPVDQTLHKGTWIKPQMDYPRDQFGNHVTVVKVLRTRCTTESNSVLRQNLIGCLIVNLKLNIKGRKRF